ncbi:hypothetical protein [Sedimenticola hydrogenitrophicus]|uniref:hypothetical protein n=1 Tax=Sedimenticola hydrogenitrophicus TaxID=2967975 RepID=UPI0023AF44C0|nr:hypothetical protein [Sedimenticola hydrogenitrophicus]
MHKKTFVIIIILISNIAVLIVGMFIGRKSIEDNVFKQYNKVKYQVMLGHYTTYRDIAVNVREGNYQLAKCNAELTASALLDSLETCINDRGCKAFIEQQVKEHAPEVMDKNMLKFDYIQTIDDIKKCH